MIAGVEDSVDRAEGRIGLLLRSMVPVAVTAKVSEWLPRVYAQSAGAHLRNARERDPRLVLQVGAGGRLAAKGCHVADREEACAPENVNGGD